MTILGLVILIVAIGILIQYIPMDPTARNIALAILGLIALIVVLRWSGLLTGAGL